MARYKSINPTNPLVSTSPQDTIDHCREVLTWMEQITDDASGCYFGRALVLMTINGALEHASAQVDARARPKPALEVVNG